MVNPPPKSNWRLSLRNLHRDFGFFAVGLTVIYALSGLAVNHIGQWDPSFSHFERLISVEEPLPEDETEAVASVLSRLDISDTPVDVFTTKDTLVRYDIELPGKQVQVRPDRDEIEVTETGKEGSLVYPLGDGLPEKDWDAAITALHRIGIADEPTRVERVTIPVRDIDIIFDGRNLTVQDYQTGYDVYDVGQKPRFFLRTANWLHLNRGKAAWTYISDAYAIVLLFLAFSGMLMVRGRKGLIGRGGIFLLIGIAVPVIYLIVSGGP